MSETPAPYGEQPELLPPTPWETTVADRCVQHFSQLYRTHVQAMTGPGPLPWKADEASFACLLMAEEFAGSLGPTSRESLSLSKQVIEQRNAESWYNILPWDLVFDALMKHRFPSTVPSFSMECLLENLTHHNSVIRAFMFELAWFVRKRLPLQETSDALLKNTADTLGHWDWSLGLCSFLYDDTEKFLAAADGYKPEENFQGQYRERIDYVKNGRLSTCRAKFINLDRETRQVIADYGLRLRVGQDTSPVETPMSSLEQNQQVNGKSSEPPAIPAEGKKTLTKLELLKLAFQGVPNEPDPEEEERLLRQKMELARQLSRIPKPYQPVIEDMRIGKGPGDPRSQFFRLKANPEIPPMPSLPSRLELLKQAKANVLTKHPEWRSDENNSSSATPSALGTTVDTAGVVFEAATGSPVNAVAFLSDGLHAVSGGSDGLVRLWDVKAGKQVGLIGKHPSGVCCLAVHESKLVVTGGGDDHFRVWDIEARQEIKNLSEGAYYCTCVAFSLDGKLIVVGCAGKGAILWNWQSGETENFEEGNFNDGCGMAVAFLPDGKRVLIDAGSTQLPIEGGMTEFWQIHEFGIEGHLLETHLLLGMKDGVSSLAVSRDGKYGFAASASGGICRWKLDWLNWTEDDDVLFFADQQETFHSISPSPLDDGFLSASSDGSLRCWRGHSKKPVAIVKAHQNSVASVAYSPCGHFAVSGGSDGMIRFWDTAYLAGGGRIMPEKGQLPLRVMFGNIDDKLTALLTQLLKNTKRAKFGLEVSSTGDGTQLEKMLSSQSFDLCILVVNNLVFPDCGVSAEERVDKALELVGRVTQNCKIPVISLADGAMPNIEDRAKHANSAAFFHMPFDAKKLIAVVDELSKHDEHPFI